MTPLRGQALDRRVEQVLDQLGEFFMGQSPVHKTARAIAQRLAEMGIDYAVAGALAVGVHGLVRATEDVDILIRREDLARFKEAWLGRGYVNLFPDSKAVRDTEHGVKIDFLLSGDYPGDGKPKPVAFPDPAGSDQTALFRALPLVRLLEMKIACGMTAPHRLRDLDDVLRLVRARNLPRDFADKLDPYVRAKFDELWQLAQHADEDY